MNVSNIMVAVIKYVKTASVVMIARVKVDSSLEGIDTVVKVRDTKKN
jgi:hypothetical protein